MKWYLKNCIVVFLVMISAECSAQIYSLPVFKMEKAGLRQECNLNCSMEKSFKNLYSRYFETACGNYYHVVKFNIDTSGKVTNIRFDNPSSFMKEFIEEFLMSTNGKWGLKETAAGSKMSKTMILPIYFYFRKKCDPELPNSIHYYTTPSKEHIEQSTENGYTIQTEENDSILLWPAKLVGPTIYRNYFFKKN